jgi:dTDP-4-amino-4,6-dideoxy-D-galactose acyltransferase|tara:strand:+ start:686 stop:1861 length:1176 start_codon:yes stop_codon:yes gene_type:complete
MLIIKYQEDCQDIKSRVYRETLEFIARNSMNVTVHKFKDNQCLLEVIHKHDFSSVVTTHEISFQTSILLKGLNLVQIVIGKNSKSEDVADIIIDPLIPKSEKFFVGSKYLLPSVAKNIPIESIAKLMKMNFTLLQDEINYNEAETDLLDIVSLCQKREWDSNFFGVNVGYISCLRLTPNIEKYIKKFVRKEKIDLLEYLCNCHDKESVSIAEINNYSFVDIRITFEQTLNNKMIIEESNEFSFRKGEEKDIEKLREIAKGIYKYSRYCYDTNFDRDKVFEFYSGWVEKAILGQFDDYAYILCHNDEPVGFCTITEHSFDAARIGLVGIASNYTGNRLAQYLLNMSMLQLQQKGIKYMDVVTQGRNYAAQRLYQKCGFVTKMTELWYHKWFR